MLIQLLYKSAVTRIRTWVIAATTQCTNHYTITAVAIMCILQINTFGQPMLTWCQ